MADPRLNIGFDATAAIERVDRYTVRSIQARTIRGAEDQISLGGQEQHRTLEVRRGGWDGGDGEELADGEGILGCFCTGEDRWVEVWVLEEGVLVRGAVGPSDEARAVLFRGEPLGRIGGRKVEGAACDE